jgi:hypothetical protein
MSNALIETIKLSTIRQPLPPTCPGLWVSHRIYFEPHILRRSAASRLHPPVLSPSVDSVRSFCRARTGPPYHRACALHVPSMPLPCMSWGHVRVRLILGTLEMRSVSRHFYGNGRHQAPAGADAGAYGPLLALRQMSNCLCVGAQRTAAANQTFNGRWTAWGSRFGGSGTNGNAVVGSNYVTARDFGFTNRIDYQISPKTWSYGMTCGALIVRTGRGVTAGAARSVHFRSFVKARFERQRSLGRDSLCY